jgi:Ni,Fe-hydrogenase III large subunit/Ni,Fe-hydrogenase III component G
MSLAANQSELPDYLPEHLGAVREPGPPDEVRLRVSPLGLGRASQMLHRAGARFVTLLIATAPEPAIVGAFAMRGDLVVLRAPTAAAEQPTYTALGPWWPAAQWTEQELADRDGARPVGLVDLPALTRPDADTLERTVHGLDVFSLPFGPVRSGVFEAIQFLIETGGEDVTRVRTRPFFKHRGLEQRVVGMAPGEAVHVAERIAGISSVAYALAFSQAIERALAVTPPPRAERWRAVHAELERIACHLDVIAKQAETTALAVGHARFGILKEQIMRLRARLTGSRFGRGAVLPGGIREEGRVAPEELLSELDAFERDLARDRRLFLSTASMTDRLIGTGRLPRPLVEEYSAVGPVARGSGLSTDARHERPYGEYRRLGLQVVTHREEDAMSRVLVRFSELTESLRILRQACEHLRRTNGELAAPLPVDGSGCAFGWVEAAQGELIIWVEVTDGLVSRMRVASPSFRNWALFDHAFPTDVLTDFAFIEHSFGLTAAGADR